MQTGTDAKFPTAEGGSGEWFSPSEQLMKPIAALTMAAAWAGISSSITRRSPVIDDDSDHADLQDAGEISVYMVGAMNDAPQRRPRRLPRFSQAEIARALRAAGTRAAA